MDVLGSGNLRVTLYGQQDAERGSSTMSRDEALLSHISAVFMKRGVDGKELVKVRNHDWDILSAELEATQSRNLDLNLCLKLVALVALL